MKTLTFLAVGSILVGSMSASAFTEMPCKSELSTLFGEDILNVPAGVEASHEENGVYTFKSKHWTNDASEKEYKKLVKQATTGKKWEVGKDSNGADKITAPEQDIGFIGITAEEAQKLGVGSIEDPLDENKVRDRVADVTKSGKNLNISISGYKVKKIAYRRKSMKGVDKVVPYYELVKTDYRQITLAIDDKSCFFEGMVFNPGSNQAKLSKLTCRAVYWESWNTNNDKKMINAKAMVQAATEGLKSDNPGKDVSSYYSDVVANCRKGKAMASLLQVPSQDSNAPSGQTNIVPKAKQ